MTHGDVYGNLNLIEPSHHRLQPASIGRLRALPDDLQRRHEPDQQLLPLSDTLADQHDLRRRRPDQHRFHFAADRHLCARLRHPVPDRDRHLVCRGGGERYLAVPIPRPAPWRCCAALPRSAPRRQAVALTEERARPESLAFAAGACTIRPPLLGVTGGQAPPRMRGRDEGAGRGKAGGRLQRQGSRQGGPHGRRDRQCEDVDEPVRRDRRRGGAAPARGRHRRARSSRSRSVCSNARRRSAPRWRWAPTAASSC